MKHSSMNIITLQNHESLKATHLSPWLRSLAFPCLLPATWPALLILSIDSRLASCAEVCLRVCVVWPALLPSNTWHVRMRIRYGTGQWAELGVSP